MRKEQYLFHQEFSVEQTEMLLGTLDHLPASGSAARRIRERVLLSAAPKAHSRNRIRKTLLPTAACLLAIVLFFVASPKAAHAVSAFIEHLFVPGWYMNEDPSARTPIPSIDEAIAAAVPNDETYNITLMSDLPSQQDFASFRALNGYAPFSEDNWGWLRDIRPEIAEVLYDGNQLIWNTNLYMDNVHVREFMECYGFKSGCKITVDALMGDVTYTVAGDPTVYSLQVSGHGITPVSDESTLTSADHVVLYSDFYIDPARPLPDGILTITQNIRVCENDAMSYGATVAIITHTFTFDTTKGTTPAAESAEAMIPLSGEVYLSITQEETDSHGNLTNWILSTKKVSLDGVTLKATFEYLPTGITVFLSVAEKPDDWTDDMTRGLLTSTEKSIYGDYLSPGIAADLYRNGVLADETSIPGYWTNGELTYILPIFPEQYASLQSAVIKLSLYHYITLHGTNLLDGETLYLPLVNDINLESNVEGVPLVDIPVPLP